ncbi:MAG: RsmE family RNA methyltransferase [Planctomycetia bacterium]|nr:RsmE family RNA methyltransferase [Planctomycetia bacterium]
MAYRYYSSQTLPEVPATVTLSGDEAHHLIHVMRVKAGQGIVLFDGSGAEFDGLISAVRKKEMDVELSTRREVSRENERRLTLAVALPKGDRQKWLVEKITELGVTEFLPLDAEFSVAKAGAAAAERLGRVVIEASKQCGRNTLLRIAEPISTQKLWTMPAEGTLRLLSHPGGVSLGEALSQNAEAPVLAAVGPEGGFSEKECALALANGWQAVSLGRRILRTETAAIAIAAMLSSWPGNLPNVGR